MSWGISAAPIYTPPFRTTGAVTSAQVTLQNDSFKGLTFYVRSRDRALNDGPIQKIGPFKIDTVRPTLGAVKLNNGAARTTDITAVNVSVASATDDRSGIAGIRYASPSWSAFMPYATGRSIDLTKLGQSRVGGVKKVVVQVVDKAGNVSAVREVSILYTPIPKITSLPNQFPNLFHGNIIIAGSGLSGVTEIQIGNHKVTKLWTPANDDDWWEGRIQHRNDNNLWFYPPQNLAPGTYSIKVKSGFGHVSNSMTTKATAIPGSTYMVTQNAISVGKTQRVAVAFGGNPVGTTQLTVFSPIRRPSIIPGLVKLSIGGNWSQFFMLPRLGFDNRRKSSIVSGTVPQRAKGATVYFQTVFFHPTQRPLPVSQVRTVRYK